MSVLRDHHGHAHTPSVTGKMGFQSKWFLIMLITGRITLARIGHGFTQSCLSSKGGLSLERFLKMVTT